MSLAHSYVMINKDKRELHNDDGWDGLFNVGIVYLTSRVGDGLNDHTYLIPRFWYERNRESFDEISNWVDHDPQLERSKSSYLKS